MRLLVLPQVFHDGEIHTVDINSTNTLVATGGRDANVNVWQLDQFTQLVGQTPPKIQDVMPIKVINKHTSTVKFVKWCPVNEHEFISADASGVVMLTNMKSENSEVIFPGQSRNQRKGREEGEDEGKDKVKGKDKGKEKHLDFTSIDGCWAKDGRLFVWSTSDGKVHIYDSSKRTHQCLISQPGRKKDPIATIQRSISFDPTGKYLVCLGDDTMVTIFQYDYDKNNDYKFQVTNRISRLMSNSTTKSLGIDYKRISWSCDGEFFAVPNATKQSTAVVSLLSASSNWENNISLVGHDLECDLVKFAPHIFENRGESLASTTSTASAESDLEIIDYEVYHIVATAGSNNSLVLWNTSKESPIFVVNEISSKPLVDLVWDKQGRFLLMTTLNGQIIVVGFQDGELGQPASSDFLQKFKATQRQAKKQNSIKKFNESSGGRKTKLQLEAEADAISQVDAVNVKENVNVRNESNYSDSNDTFVSADQNQDVTLTPSKTPRLGEITPQVLAPGIDFSGTTGSDFMSILDNRSMSGVSSPKKPSAKASVLSNTEPKAVGSASASAPAPSPIPAAITMKNGKKRIQPTTLINGTKAQPDSPKQKLPGVSAPTKSSMEFEKPSYVIDEATKDTKKQKSADEGPPNKKPRREIEPIKFIGSIITNPTTSFAQVRLSVPKVRSAFRIPDSPYALEIKNGHGNESAPSRVTCFRDESQVWTDFIPQFISLATKGSMFWAITTCDGVVHTYSSTSGRRLLPPLVLGSPVSFLESKNQYLMAVTSVAEVYVWDLDKKKIVMKAPSSLASLLDSHSKLQENTLSKADNITMCSVTSKGMPVTTLSNGSGYIYNSEMEVWQTVSEPWWAFGSHYWDSLDDNVSPSAHSSGSSTNNDASSIISMLEHKTNEELFKKTRSGRGKLFNKISKNMMMKEGFENLENTVSLSHLENRIMCSEILEENADFKEYLITYTNRLCELGLQAKLFEVCDGILGASQSSPVSAASAVSEAPTDSNLHYVCGFKREDLLKDIILACAEHRDAQRILVHFGNKIGLISRDYE